MTEGKAASKDQQGDRVGAGVVERGGGGREGSGEVGWG